MPDDALDYLSGFENQHTSEALAGALPLGRNSPQRPPYGLYAEQISGSAFTAPRATNRRTWFYRLRPSVKHAVRFRETDKGLLRTAPCREESHSPANQLRWDPVPIPDQSLDFVHGLHTMMTNGDCHMQAGIGVHLYLVTESMNDSYFSNSDGEMLIVPQQGALRFVTEAGILEAAPGEVCVIPRGYKYRVELIDGPARGYICENYGAHLTLPELGPIGSNGLANPRDFLYPTAHYEDIDRPSQLYLKHGGNLFVCELDHSPLDVIAWHGNHLPYKYDLRNFCPMNAVSFDHPDPSINTVLTSQSDTPGIANVDFVIFPDRWTVAEDTFRPPWYHINIMSEFMGLIYGVYDAKPQGFAPGGMSLHNGMLPHGPSADAFAMAAEADLQPTRMEGTMAFMFESRYPFILTEYAAQLPQLQENYADCWNDLAKQFQQPSG